MASITIPERPVIVSLRPAPPMRQAGDAGRDPVFLETNGYAVRSLSPHDASEAFLGWFNTPEMLGGLNIGNLDFTLERLKSFIAGFDNRRNYFLGIFHSEEVVGFYTIDVNLLHKVANITTGIGRKDYLGKKTLWATIDAVLDYFYAHRDIEKFTARILAKNYAMLFNFKSNTRFSLEAHLKRECRTPDGRRVDLLVFASHKTRTGSDVPHRVDPRHVIEKHSL